MVPSAPSPINYWSCLNSHICLPWLYGVGIYSYAPGGAALKLFLPEGGAQVKRSIMNKQDIPFKGILFDLDGTLIDSLPAVDRAWRAWAKKVGLDDEQVMQIIHGRPARESVTELLAGACAEIIDQEVAWLEQFETHDTQGTVVLPGTLAFLHLLNKLKVPWAIVTSGTLPVASARIKATQIAQPSVLITPECVTYGKPHPEPFLLGAQTLGLRASDCIVFEDAPAGIKAGKLAGCTVIGILSHHSAAQLQEAQWHIPSLQGVTVVANENGFLLQPCDS